MMLSITKIKFNVICDIFWSETTLRSVSYTVHHFIWNISFSNKIESFGKRIWKCLLGASVCLASCPNIKHVNNFVNSKFRQISCQLYESTTSINNMYIWYCIRSPRWRNNCPNINVYASPFLKHLKQSFQ